MPLNWSIANCKNWESLKSDEEWPVTNALIWGSMSVDLSGITEKNITEYYARISVWEGIVGAFVNTKKSKDDPVTPRHITLEDLQKRIGMTTNVSNASRAEWLKRLNTYFKNKLSEAEVSAARELLSQKTPTPTE
jgi:hypothetical protein